MYTVEIYKQDRRVKTGERLVHKDDYRCQDRSMLEHTVRHTWPRSEGFRYEIHETMVSRRNMMTGTEYQERYDMPRSCSPASEAFWSM